MIIEALLNAIITIFTSVLNFVNIPQLDSNLVTEIENFVNGIINFSKSLINLALPYNIAVILGTIVLVIEGMFYVYALVMWVLRKIPVVSIE